MQDIDQDDLGNAYEYLIKQFADDSGHTAAEFYTNRTVVHLMARILGLQPGESAYDPTCGTGGMLLNAVINQTLSAYNDYNFGTRRNLIKNKGITCAEYELTVF